MPSVRKIGAQLVKEGIILVTQRGTIVDLPTARGPVRFGLAKEGNTLFSIIDFFQLSVSCLYRNLCPTHFSSCLTETC